MDFDRMMAELFADEDRARAMATRLMELSKKDPPAAAREKDSLLAFLRGPLERHMDHEERLIFPLLAQRNLAPEIEVAQKQHSSIRTLAENLANATTTDGIARAVFFAAQRMLHHTNFEGDYIYPELNREEWRSLMRETSERKA